MATDRKELIRTIYLYLFSLVGLVLIVVGTTRLVNLALRTWVFTKADDIIIYPPYPKRVVETAPGVTKEESLTPEEEAKYRAEQEEYERKNRRSQRERTAAESLAMIIVGAPLFLYHWKVIQKTKAEKSA
jgi:hypothetical protein